MSQELQALKDVLERRVTEALTRQAMANRGTLLPFRLPATAQALVAALLDAGTGMNGPARALGQSLNQQGLGLPSLLEAQATTLETIAGAGDVGSHASAVGAVSRFFSMVIQGFVEAEAVDIGRRRDEMERAFLNAISQQHEQEERFQHTLSELSTPIIPVHEGVLVLPLIGTIDSRRATEITERLLEAISANQAEMVIIDITGVPVIDTAIANHLLVTTRAAHLLGSRVVLVGIGPDIAQTLVHLGVELRGLVTLANLQSGIAYALKQKGLGIQQLDSRSASDQSNYEL